MTIENIENLIHKYNLVLASYKKDIERSSSEYAKGYCNARIDACHIILYELTNLIKGKTVE